jgi:hypothetical protein
MIAETPIEITHVPGRLRQDFTGRIPEAPTGTAEEKEVNFLSRALAAFALNRLASCALDEAATSIVDGGGDGGIDAIWYSAASHKLWLVQSKFIRDGRGEPGLGDVAKFKTGLENLLQGNFAAFESNAAWRTWIPRLQAIFKDGTLEVRAVLVYSGTATVSEDRRRMFQDLHIRFSPDSDYLQIQTCNLTTIHDWITGADQGPGIPEVELKLLKPGWLKEPYETVYGLVSLAEIAALYRNCGPKLVAANIRAYKGRTEVNEHIALAVREEPQHFLYLNNGLTAYCERLEVNNLDRANAEEKRIRALGFSIVNGAQTLGSIASAVPNPPEPPPAGHVFLKVISLERCEDDVGFAERITRSTNFQNQIGDRDFVALDEQQERIANQLVLSGVAYHYKEGEDTPAPDATNFTLDEATSACALMANGADCDFCARVLSNRRSFWSFDEVFPAGDLYRSRYAKAFRPDLSARAIWRAVQAQRIVKNALKTSETGVRKDFFDNGRWLVLSVIFLRLRPQLGDDLALTAQDETTLTQAAQDYAERLWTLCQAQGFVSARAGGGWEVPRHFRSVFSAAADCRLLRGALMANLDAAPVALPAAAGQSNTGTP